MTETNTWINAIIGAVVTVLLSFTAVSPVIGGAVTAYLEKADTDEGLRSGALSGAIVLVPMVLFGFVALGLVGLFALPFEPGGVIALGLLAVFGIAIAAIYVVGLSALGGYLGAYLYREYGGGSGREGEPDELETDEREREVRV